MTVLFHGNFSLHRARMSGVLQAALSNPNVTDVELSKPFGYGAPFGARYRSWLHKTGLAEMGLPMKLTTLGKVVFENDPSLENTVSQWFLHHELVTDSERAEAWHYFSHEFLPNHPTFTKNALIDGLTEKLRPHSEMHFGPGSKLNQQIARKIIQVYTNDSALGQLGIIRPDGTSFISLKAKVRGPWQSESELRGVY